MPETFLPPPVGCLVTRCYHGPRTGRRGQGTGLLAGRIAGVHYGRRGLRSVRRVHPSYVATDPMPATGVPTWPRITPGGRLWCSAYPGLGGAKCRSDGTFSLRPRALILRWRKPFKRLWPVDSWTPPCGKRLSCRRGRRRRRQAEARARLDYETAREEYRPYLDRGIDDPDRRARWERSPGELEEAQAAREDAARRLEIFRTQILDPAQQELDRVEEQFRAELGRLRRIRDLKAGSACLGYAMSAFALTFALFNTFRRSPPPRRHAVIGTSLLGFGAAQALLVSLWIAYPFLADVVPVEAIVFVGGSGGLRGSSGVPEKPHSLRSGGGEPAVVEGACPACGFPAPGAFCPWCGAEQTVACPRCG